MRRGRRKIIPALERLRHEPLSARIAPQSQQPFRDGLPEFQRPVTAAVDADQKNGE
jgi:hypothetical protein